jgi:c-di-GMP-binding flagellar brake protein YcgR
LLISSRAADPLQGWRERRKADRKLLRSPARLVFEGHSEIHGRTADISVGGIGVLLQVNLRKHMRCEVTFELPVGDGDILLVSSQAMITGVVLGPEKEGFRTGLQFIDLEPHAAAAIARFVEG